MKAARFYDNSDVRVDEVPEPVVGPGQVGIDVAWCGICATDLREFVDGPLFIPNATTPNPTTGETAPVIIGHEISGVVSELGAGVTDLEIGDHVVVEPIILPDGVDTEHYNTHPLVTVNGVGGRSGGLSEKMALDRRWVYKIDKSLPLDAAALVEPLAISRHAVELSEVEPGQTVLVSGAGPLGLMVAQMLKMRGVRLIINEPLELRRELAQEFTNADFVINPNVTDVYDEVMRITDGAGIDAGFECSADPAALNRQIRMLKPRGKLIILAYWKHTVEVDVNRIVRKELRILGSMMYSHDHPAAIQLMEDGEIDPAPLITHRIGIDELVSFGYDRLINRPDSAVKILVSPSGAGLDPAESDAS